MHGALSVESDLVCADAHRGDCLANDADVFEKHEHFEAHSVDVTSQRMSASDIHAHEMC